MRVVLVTEYYYPHLGGVPEHVENLATQLRLCGHAPVILTGGMHHSLPDPEHVRRIGTSRLIFSNASFARITTGVRLREAIERILRDEKADLVHIHGPIAPTLGLVAQSAADRVGVPVVATFHSWFPRSLGFDLFRRALQHRLDRIAAMIAVSQPVIDAHSRYFSGRWEVIPNGVDTGYFHPNGRRPEDAVREPRILFLGRLDPRNGLETVIGAMPAVVARYSQAKLIVAGDGPLRRYYRHLAAPLGERVHFVGPVFEDRDEWYGRCDLYVCPTRRASFGITLLEAMACGRPMIVSDIVGFRELVAGTNAAVIVPPGDAGAWAAAVIRLLDDPELRARMGAAGRAAVERYAWPSVARRIFDVYERVTR